MTTSTDRLQAALARIDAANAEDLNRDSADGIEQPRELIYGRRMSACLAQFQPEASEALQLAARAQHIRRWAIPRADFPMDRHGYKLWRTRLGRFHAETTAELLRETGYEPELIERVEGLLRKENLKRDPDAQALEDVACLVFLEHYFEEFAGRYDDDKLIDILQKTWRKMSAHGHAAALKLPLSERALDLVGRALAPRG